jgi:NAD-dependent protein deacetylase/lipoamidase
MAAPARPWQPALEAAAAALAQAETVFIFTGSGMSAESGVPTFRGADGLWEGVRPEDVATPEAFARDPTFVWQWYKARILAHEKAKPNPGHKAIAKLQDLYGRATLATQNVDLLHERGGSRAVLRLHGRMSHVKCPRCGHLEELGRSTLRKLPPPCPACGSPLRPDVVWFGETLPEGAFQEASAAAAACDAALVVGTSNLVYPAASLPLLAKSQGARLVEVNPERSDLTAESDHFLQGPAGLVLPALAKAVAPLRRARPAKP